MNFFWILEMDFAYYRTQPNQDQRPSKSTQNILQPYNSVDSVKSTHNGTTSVDDKWISTILVHCVDLNDDVEFYRFSNPQQNILQRMLIEKKDVDKVKIEKYTEFR